MNYYGYDFICKSDLTHHGILGQKWGKKNGPPYPLDAKDHSASEQKAGWKKSLNVDNFHKQVRISRQVEISNYEKDLIKKAGLTPAQKKKYAQIAIGAASAIGIGAGIYFAYKYNAVNKIAELSKDGNLSKEASQKVLHQVLKDGDEVLKQGSVLHRMSAYADVDYSQATKPLYTSFDKVDVATYMTRLKDWHGTGERYDVTLKALEDIKIPSKKHAEEIFQELWDSDPSYQKQLQETITYAYKKILDKNPRYRMQKLNTLAIAQRQAKVDIQMDPFKSAMYSIVKGKDDSKKLLGFYQARGYQAIIDYFDQGDMAKSPLIVLDPSKTLQKQGEVFVTKEVKIRTLEELIAQGERVLGTGEPIKYVLSELKRS